MENEENKNDESINKEDNNQGLNLENILKNKQFDEYQSLKTNKNNEQENYYFDIDLFFLKHKKLIIIFGILILLLIICVISLVIVLHIYNRSSITIRHYTSINPNINNKVYNKKNAKNLF